MPNFTYKLTQNITEAVATVGITKAVLGYAPDELYCQHTIQVTGALDGTWGVDVLGPGDQWYALTTGLAANDIVVLAPYNQGYSPNGNAHATEHGLPFTVMGRFQAFRITVSGAGTSLTHVRSDSMQAAWG